MSILLNLLFFVATIPVRIGRSRARIRDHNSFWWKKKEREREREREKGKGILLPLEGRDGDGIFITVMGASAISKIIIRSRKGRKEGRRTWCSTEMHILYGFWSRNWRHMYVRNAANISVLASHSGAKIPIILVAL